VGPRLAPSAAEAYPSTMDEQPTDEVGSTKPDLSAPTRLELLIAEGRVRLPTEPKRPGDADGVPVQGSVSDLVSRQRGR
jgi:hypothetical protein